MQSSIFTLFSSVVLLTSLTLRAESGRWDDAWDGVGQGYTEVPDDIPSTATSMSLYKNSITAVRAGDFSAGFPVCETVTLSYNQISVIEDGAFTGGSHLMLNMERNTRDNRQKYNTVTMQTKG